MKKSVLFSTLALVAVWLIWLIAYYIVGNDLILPSVGDTFSAALTLLTEAAFWLAFWNTFARTLAAFAVSLLFGVLLALLARVCRFVRAFLSPVVSILRTVPTMAVTLMLLLWTSPAVAPVIVSVLVLFPAIYAAMLAALDEADEQYGVLADAYGVNLWKRVTQMYLPLTLSSMLKQLGAIASMGLKITISGEVLAATYQSFGGMMQEAKMWLQIPRLMAFTLVAIVLGFLLELAFALLEKLFVRWKR